MKQHHLVFLLVLLLFAAGGGLAQTDMMDVVYLKSGTIVRGMIIEQIPNKSLRIETTDGSIMFFTFEEIEKIAKERRSESAGNPARLSIAHPDEKSPVAAGLFSVLLPGAGQYYTGETGVGLLHTGLFAGGIVLALTAGSRDFSRTESTSFGTSTTSGDEPTAWLYVGLGISGATLVWSVVDAVTRTNEYNRNLQSAQLDRKSGAQSEQRSVVWAVIPLPDGVAFGISLKL